MAEAVLLGVAKSVLGQLSSPALKEFLRVWNFKKDLKRLAETIEALTCFIYDAEQRQTKERLVRKWLSRLRAVLYEADDLFDAIGARALHKKAIGGSTFKKEVTLFFSKSNHLSLAIKTASDIKAIRECLDGIKDDMSSFQFQYQKVEEQRPHSVLEREERHSFVDKNEVIGRDQEREDIVSLLLSEGCRNRNLEVISVIGFGGLGKTTLAQLVYNDERVQTGFDLCLWACINYLSDLELVLVKILESKPHEFHLDQLQRELREKIQGKKYLLVLDDVWDENASNWDKLKILLNCGKIGSKVLVTTRKTRVAQCLDAIEPYYRLNTLSFESAWSLFVKMAFKDGEFEEDPDLVLVGKQILEKCGFVPLALTTIGRMLRYRKKDKEEWLSFLEKEFAEVVSSDVDDGNLMQVLKISYNDLPLAVKHCFAYCSVFPKDHWFGRDELVRMWIAQGFVESHAKKSLEEVGDDYFFYMADRCFFQDVSSVYYGIGDVRHMCLMHDLLHDLAIQVAESRCNSVLDKDLSEIVERSTVLDHISITCSRKCSIDFSNMPFLSKSLRTLRFVNAEHIKIDSLKLVLDRCTKIRTLVLKDMEFETLPDIFEGLIHLRYLDLSGNPNLISLPNSICKLYRLQTLLLTSCVSLVELPSNLNKLVSLRHLVLMDCMKLDSMPSGLASLTTLVSLDRLIVHPKRGGLRYLGCLDELCGMLTLELPVNGWNDCVEDARKANLQRKYRLSGVSIKCSTEGEEGELSTEKRRAVLEELEPHANIQNLQIENYIGDKLPSWFSSLPNLKQLSLKKCDLEFIDVGSSCAYLLPRLEFLELRGMPRLKGWCSRAASPRGDAPMSTVLKLPRLSKLRIGNCESLVGNMPICEALQELNLEAVNVRLLNTFLSNPNAESSPQRHDYNSKLRYLFLQCIEGLECLSESSLQRMTALKRLLIFSCESLSWVSRRGLACLTSLESLSIYGCGGVRLEDEEDRGPYSNIISNFGLQRLSQLTMPWQSHFLRDHLHLFPSLQFLTIEYFEEHQVETDNEDLECCTKMWWQGSKKLEQVELSFGSMACCFPNWVLHLPGLTVGLQFCGEMNTDGWVAQQTQSNCLDSLRIHSNKDILWIHDIPWNLLPSLRTLQIYSDINTIPSGIQQIPSLRSLDIWSNRELKEIPKWMMNLTSLQNLCLSANSAEFKLRCEPEIGADWHLISHIPNVRIRQTFQSRHGQAYLFKNVVNVTLGETEDREMMTGLHTVADIFCVGCGSILGWRYEFAHEIREKYKEGKSVLEWYKICGAEGNSLWVNHEGNVSDSDADDS